MHFDLEDTIVAPITPAGISGIGVVRISGEQAWNILEGMTGKSRSEFQHRKATLANLYDPLDNSYIDRSVITTYHAPESYTGESVLEISVHGNPLLVQAICEGAMNFGARMAEPGEFTRRAFLSGKIDLSQAEAVQELISAGSLLAAKAAGRRLSGELREVIADMRNHLIESLVVLEAAVDFPEEELEILSEGEIIRVLENAQSSIDRLLRSYRTGRILAEGMRIVIAGRPNVGKSSLLNCLLGEERAIVSPDPGTTRDYISEPMHIKGIPVKVIDTAGIRMAPGDSVEVEGAKRSMRAISEADLVLMVIDGSQDLSEEDRACKEIINGKEHMLVVNKRDKGIVARFDSLIEGENYRGQVSISAKTRKGLDDLEEMVMKVASGGISSLENDIIIGNVRQKQMLTLAVERLQAGIKGLKGGLSAELVSFEIRDAARFLGEFMGEITSEEVLDAIFSRFCIGK